MIQYQYFHRSDGYKFLLSIEKSDSKYDSSKSVFENVRQGIKGRFFVYATAKSSAVFVKSDKEFVQGYLCENMEQDITVYPANYIDTFPSAASNEAMSATKLPDGSLPNLGRKIDDFSIARELRPIFAKLIDALLYGDNDKEIVIRMKMGDSKERENAIKYMKVLSMLFPLSFMKKVGFCVGSTYVSPRTITYSAGNNEFAELSIKICFFENDDFNLADYVAYYTFDTVSGRDNYTRELSPIAKVLEEINLSNTHQLSKFAEDIKSAFDSEGNVDFEKLNKIAIFKLFEAEKTVSLSKNILAMPLSEDAFHRRVLIDAINYLITSNNLTNEERNYILSIYNSNPEIANGIENSLFNYLLASYATLQDQAQQTFAQMVANDDQNNRLQVVLDNALRKNTFEAFVEAFKFSVDILRMRTQNIEDVIVEQKQLIEKMVNFSNISQVARKIPPIQLNSGEAFFEIALLNDNREFKYIIAAILMTSVYFRNTNDEYRRIRICGLKRMIEENHSTVPEKLEAVIKVRDQILKITDEIPFPNISSNSNNQRDFIFAESNGKPWVQGMILSLTVKSAIEEYRYVRNRTYGARLYEDMSNAIQNRLLDVSYVRKTVAIGTDLFEIYKDFFISLPDAIKEQAADVQRFLDELDIADNVNDKFSQYRCSFAYDCYTTLSKADKCSITENYKEPIPKEGFNKITDKDARSKLVENTIKQFGVVANVKKAKKRNIKPVVIWAFGFSVLASLILVFPAIVQVLAHNSFDITLVINRMADILFPVLAFIPLGVFALNIITYFLLREGNKIKRANIITILCAILPLLTFSIGCLLFYFFGIEWKIPFLQGFLN